MKRKTTQVGEDAE